MITEGTINLIKKFEGRKLTAYLDSVGVWTIGYGTTMYMDGTRVKKGNKITQERADELLKLDLERRYKAINYLFNNVVLTRHQLEALMSLCYNIGIGAFSKSTLIRKVRVNPSDPTIRKEFMKWVFGGGQVIQGLVNRRKAEADIYFS